MKFSLLAKIVVKKIAVLLTAAGTSSALALGIWWLAHNHVCCARGRDMDCPVIYAQDIARLIPTSTQDVDQRITHMKAQLRSDVHAIVAIESAQRTFDNTARAIDEAARRLSITMAPIDVLTLVHPDKALRDHARDTLVAVQAFTEAEFSRNSKLFAAFKAYYEGAARTEKLSAQERYFVDELMRDWKRAGMLLPEPELEKVRQLSNQLGQLGIDFQRNIDQDETTLTFTAKQLEGVPTHILASLSQDENGYFIVRMEPPVIDAICKHAHDEATRRNTLHAYGNRAYPVNNALLKQIVVKRNEFARLLGYPNIATLEIENQMAQSPAHVQTFVDNLVDKTKNAQEAEIARLRKVLPPHVQLDKNGLIKTWDLPYIKEWYKQTFMQLDSRVIAQYFPVDHVVAQTMSIYQTFLGLTFADTQATGLWDKDVRCVSVSETQTGQLLGFLLMDLHPRPGKYSHACQVSIISGQKRGGKMCPSVVCIIANFPKKTAAAPALLPYGDVKTFFHEFGHAMHAIVAIAELYSQSGVTDKADFFEIPSQLMEKWLEDKNILRRLSKHHQTGDPLPDAMIEQLVSIEKFDIGDFTRRQAGLARYCLALFDGAQHEIDKLYEQTMRKSLTGVMYDRAMHTSASFGHLTTYGSRYYSYLWSNAISHDLFAQIKKHGLLNPQTGHELVAKILAKGASAHPMSLLKDFLGREPNQDAFLHYLDQAHA